MYSHKEISDLIILNIYIFMLLVKIKILQKIKKWETYAFRITSLVCKKLPSTLLITQKFQGNIN